MGHKVAHEHMKIAPKHIGRHEGFIITVSCPTFSIPVKYYTKVQDADISTVLTHHLLKELHCGPEEFLVVNLKKPRRRSHIWRNYEVEQHGVITKEVESFIMASALSTQELQAILSDGDQYQADMFLLTLLIEFGQFANIPNNTDNWGFTKHVDANTKREFYRLAVVDFSFDDGGHNAICSEDGLAVHWRGNIHFLPKRNKQVASKDLLSVRLVTQHCRYDWLQSKQALLAMLQRVCDATCKWVGQCIKTQPCSIIEHFQILLPQEVGCPLTFQNGFLPQKRTYEEEGWVAEYQRLVTMWNRTLNSLYEWLEFPTRLNALDLLRLTKMVTSPSFLMGPALKSVDGVQTRGQKRKANVEQEEDGENE